MKRQAWAGMLVSMLLACGGGTDGSRFVPAVALDCDVNCASDVLSLAEVEGVVSRAVSAASANNARATIAVSDRVGNVLAVYRMNGAAATFRIDGGRGVSGGLEGVDTLPATLGAISKALTASYLSSAGNAFSTRTASQIIQENFNPREANQPSGPLFGVQFSQLGCSDVMRGPTDALTGPKRSPLGLAADPGGLPLYKSGRLVGGVGVMADGVYGLDLNITDLDNDLDERIAIAATAGLGAPAAITAPRITADGRSLRFSDAAPPPSGTVPALATQPGALVPVPGYFALPLRAGTAYGLAESGIRKDTGVFAAQSGFLVVDSTNANRYPPRASDDGNVSAAEVQDLLLSTLTVANRSRAQIRQPSGSAAQVSISIVGRNGEVLGLVRTPDAPVFGIDVAVQKARSAAFFSNPAAAAALLARPDANYLQPAASASISAYVARTRNFLSRNGALADGMAYSSRSIGNLARPTFPDGINGSGAGPLSKPMDAWSPFSTGLQLDLAYNAIVAAVSGGSPAGCTGLPNLANGLQIFPGGFPLYRTTSSGNAQLVGAIGISGDGVDQDDMIAFLGVAHAGRNLGTGLGHAPPAMRADTLTLPGGQLRYAQCPQAPFNNSTEQNVCAGL